MQSTVGTTRFTSRPLNLSSTPLNAAARRAVAVGAPLHSLTFSPRELPANNSVHFRISQVVLAE